MDTLPEETVSLNTTLSFVLSDRAASLRPLLVDEAASAIDLLLRQALRKTYTQFIGPLARSQSFLSSFLPTGSLQPVEEATAPFLLPSLSFAETVAASPSALISSIRVVPTSLKRLVDISAPKLNREEEIYFQSIRELITQTLGSDASVVASGDIIANPTAAARFILTVLSSLSVAGPLKFLEPVSDLFFGFLNLLPARERTTSTTISSTTSTTSSTDISSGSAEDVEVTKVLAMMGNFSASETAILRSTSSEILNKVSIRVLDRLLLLNQPAV